MRIDSSVVAMQSDRYYHCVENKNKASVSVSGRGMAAMSFSYESKERLESSRENYFNGEASIYSNNKIQKKDPEKQDGKKSGKQSEGQAAVVGLTQNTNMSQGSLTVSDTGSQLKLHVLKSLIMALRRLQMLNAKKGRPVDNSQIERLEELYKREQKRIGGSVTASVGMSAGMGTVVPVQGAGMSNMSGATVWHKTTVESAFLAETENTAFCAQGMVQTADGKQISFNVDVEMSRSFMAQYQSVSEEEYIVTDPLVINLDTDSATVTNQKFLFDIDCDGTDDEISFAGEGSGFLALDRNGDGKVNDGNELFGTKSGDGFKDLSKYDKDKNGWIDENDDVFSRLKVWTKDDNGNDKLIDLKKAGIGALYLGSAGTEFSLNSEAGNKTNGIIRKTGIYLKESGEIGTIQHVDLAL